MKDSPMSYYKGTDEEVCRRKKFFIFREDAQAWLDEQSFLRKGITELRDTYKCRWCVGYHTKKKETPEQKKNRRKLRMVLFALEMNNGFRHENIMDEIELGF